MMEYFIKFGQNAPVAAKVKQTSAGVSVAYSLNGVGFLLKIESGKLVHKTLGDGLDVEFSEGKRTVGRIKCGTSSAPYDVYCRRLRIEEAEANKSVTVEFDDGDGQKTVNIFLFAKN